MFEQSGHVALDFLQLIELQVRVGNLEQVACLDVLVNEDALIVFHQLRFDFQQPFPFKHHGQNKSRRGVGRIILFDQFAQKRFGGFFLNWIQRRGRWNGIDALPVGNESSAIRRALAVLGFPAILANVEPFVGVLVIEQKRMKRLFIGEGLSASLAGMRARLDIPVDHLMGAECVDF